MSKRAGNDRHASTTWSSAIGVDAARYALARYSDRPNLDIDLDLWTKATNDNPVFYVQYAHARVCRDPAQRRRPRDVELDRADFDPALLTHEKEGELLRALAEFPRVVASAAELREPHRVARYLEDTAAVLPPVLRQLPGAAAWATRSRPTCTGPGCVLVAATRTVLANGLGLLGVSAPERM